jgi:signal transduction histidine kinase
LAATLDLGDLAIAQLVHDLRNQLTMVLLGVECLSHRVKVGEGAAELRDLSTAAESAAALALGLLTGHPRPANRTPVDVNEIVAPIAETLTRLADRDVQIVFRPSEDRALAVATASEVARLALNLALNALEAMPDGGVLTIDTAVVEHASDAAGLPENPAPYVRLRVSDTGLGMTADVKARIFEPFFTTKIHSPGIGLSSVAFTVQQIQGRLFVESEPAAGTRTTVLLPKG